MRKLASLLLATTLVATPLVISPAKAQERHDHDHGFEGHEHFEGEHRDEWRGDIHHFHEYDFERWHNGHWLHEFHEGREGWWWVVGGVWYFYPSPIYPFPDPYTPPTVILAPAPLGAAPPSYVYYCPNPSGYYPYVPQCFSPWQRIASGVTVVAPPPVAPQQVLVAPPPQPAPVANQRELDDRQLNAYAVEFEKINQNSPHAQAHMRELEKKLEAFRQALYTRTYPAMDILRDADRLEHTIAEQRERLHN